MSYQVLARKYRPRNFEEMAGQEHVLKALVNALENNRLHHAYLFTGTRGVGKTSIARILAKSLNCDLGITAKPCGECTSCLEIAEGRSIDLIEVDAASRTKVEDTRELLDNVQYMPTKSRFKIYLIDEVHMLSNHSFNALLKTLEEPPDHVKFLLATTDPKKLPVTVLSRCLQFNLKNLSPERIVQYLQETLKKEAVNFEEDCLWHLGRAADGSMRDALSLTDQAISYSEGNLTDKSIRSMLGSIDQQEVFALLEALLNSDGDALLAKVATLSEFAPDFEALLADMLSVLHRIAVAQLVPGALDNSQGDQQQIETLAAGMRKEDVQLFYQIGILGQRDLPFAPDLRTGFEMVLLRMLAFEPLGPGETYSSDQDTGAAKKPEVKKPDLKKPDLQKPDLKKQETSNTTASATSARIPTDVKKKVAHIQPEVAPSAPKQLLSEWNGCDLGKWKELLDKVSVQGVTRTLALNCSLLKAEGCDWSLVLNEEHASLWNRNHEVRIGKALSEFFDTQIKVQIEIGKTAGETPAEAKVREQAERQFQAEQAIETDLNVQTLIRHFDGKLSKGSIYPLDQAGDQNGN